MATTDTPAHRALPKNRGVFYGGKWREVASGRSVPISSPATGEDLGVAAEGGADDIDRAVQAAADAFPAWRDTPAQERAALVRRAAQILRDHAEELAHLDAIDGGNPYQAMYFDAQVGADYMDYFAGLVTEIKGSTIPIGPGVLNYTVREPLGVIGKISAFNHPLLFATAKVGAPLVAGNTIVLKPADQTPLSSLRLAELWGDVFPSGVFNLVTGGREAGVALAEHPKVAKIGFIGSVPAGRSVMQSASGTLKALTLELGGKNALIACADVDPATAAAGIVRGMNFRYVTGQSCNSTSRVYLHEDVYDAVLVELEKAVKALKVGLPNDPETEVGCLSSQPQFDKVLSYIEIGKADGARLVCGGRRCEDPALANGFFIEPTVFADVTDDMRIASEEIFGPVVSVLKWSDEDDLMRRVNALEYGLTGSIWTHDLDRAHRLASRMQSGYIWINDAATHYVGVPFGGYKQSGVGREESIDELLACTQIKNVNVVIGATPTTRAF
ncbi:aldehyde dehydrogenase family protein [Microbaculum marinum]|uniref:Aldehyde dehydrogenase family protein n=1 Tax=Microbaculum marinum TaxID=1764581 RepID=A0AAW9RRF2_9HYPH